MYEKLKNITICNMYYITNILNFLTLEKMSNFFSNAEKSLPDDDWGISGIPLEWLINKFTSTYNYILSIF